ncbi:MAG: ATP-dependent helicase [bacterium]
MNSEQLSAFLHDFYQSGPLVVLAGAGSGKTTVMTRKIALLLASGVDPATILGLTFTRRSAREMEKRIKSHLGEDLSLEKNGVVTAFPRMDTFHATGLKLLKNFLPGDSQAMAGYYHENYSEGFRLLTTAEEQDIVSDLMAELGFGKHFAGLVLEKASRLVENLRVFDSSPEPGSDLEFEALRFLNLYRGFKIKNRFFDLQDLVSVTAHLLRTEQIIRAQLQKQFKFILVDEFQDTDFAQLTMLAHLSGDSKHVFAVGDDYQSVYEWRGAHPEFIRNFNLFFPETRKIRLTRNYRSKARILLAADSLFMRDKKKNKRFLRPTRRRKNGELDFGEKIALFEARDGAEERDFLFFKLKNLHEQDGIDYSDMAIFYRLQFQKKPVVAGLKRLGLPYRIIGEKYFFKQAVPRKIIALCRILNCIDVELLLQENISEFPDLNTFFNCWWFSKPKLFPGSSSDLELEQKNYLKLLNRNLRSGACATRWQDFITESARRLVSWKKELDSGKSFREIMCQIEDILPIYSCREYKKQFRRFEIWLETEQLDSPSAILEKAALASITSAEQKRSGPAINLMTLHACKGLEYDVVFIIGLEDGICPCWFYSGDRGDKNKWLNEEKRVFYVGLTRARDHLYLSYALQRQFYGKKLWRRPSRFLKLIPREFIEHRRVPLNLLEKLKKYISCYHQ